VEAYTLEQAEEEIADLRGQVDLLSEIIKLYTQGIPNNPSPGQVELYGDSASNLPGAVLPSGMNGTMAICKTVWQPLNTVTSASVTNLAAQQIPANDATNLAVYQIETWGDGTQGSTAQTLTFTVLLGGTQMRAVTLAAGSMGTGQAFRWRAKARVILESAPGVSAAWQSYLKVNWSSTGNIGPSNSNFAEGFTSEANLTSTVDSTVNNNLGISANWGATTGSPTLTSRVAMMGRIA
jgi:hypothetical protein